MDTEHNKSQGQFKYDIMWQQRGSGRAHDIKYEIGSFIANQTAEICAYGIRIKAYCTFNHDCQKSCTYQMLKKLVLLLKLLVKLKRDRYEFQ